MLGTWLILLPAALVLVVSAGTQTGEPIIFDHAYHVAEVEMTCSDCHVDVESLTVGGRAMPDHSICEGCHDVSSDDQCAVCHLDPDNPVGMPAARSLYSGFAHKTHSEAGLMCEACHGDLAKPDIEPMKPAMRDCQVCHLEKEATLSCEACHDGKRPTPTDHQLSSWNIDHGIEAALNTSDCSMCHAQQDCDECHQGLNLFGKPHSPTWRFDHFAETSFGGECMVCHETRETCTNCHRTTRTIPHPTGYDYANTDGGGDHRDDAAAFPETCISCHDIGNDDPTCARCHD